MKGRALAPEGHIFEFLREASKWIPEPAAACEVWK